MQRIIDEPLYIIRHAALGAMKGRMGLLVMSAALYMLCLNLPVIIVEEISGLWDVIPRWFDDLNTVAANPTYEALTELTETYGNKIGLSFASFLFMLLVPGPLTLGLSSIWLNVLRGKNTSSLMIFP